jgi:hypothetical protein
MKKVKTINKMKIKKYVILIIVGICILYAIFNSVIVDLIMKNSNTGCTKARIFTKSTGKTSYPLVIGNYNCTVFGNWECTENGNKDAQFSMLKVD